MRRALLAGVVLAGCALAACGDDGEPDRTIALLRTTPIAAASQDALLAELADAGWEVGENLTVLAADVEEVYEDEEAGRAAIGRWLDEGVDLIVALSTQSAMTAQAADLAVPVIAVTNDPVASGIVANPREPEDNITAVSFRVPPDRTLDIARQLGTDISTVGFLWPGDDPGVEPVRDGLMDAADALGIRLVDESFLTPGDAAAGVAALVAAGARVVILANASGTVRAFAEIETATRAANLPVVGNIESNDFAVAILSPDVVETYHQVGRQAVRLLRGTAVADVPVEDPGRFRLALRRSIADRLGVDLPDELVDQADDVSD